MRYFKWIGAVLVACIIVAPMVIVAGFLSSLFAMFLPETLAVLIGTMFAFPILPMTIKSSFGQWLGDFAEDHFDL